MIWRADGIADVLAAFGRGFGSLMILAVHADAASPAIRVLVRGTKGGKAPTRLFAALVLNDEASRPTPFTQTILAGKGSLPLARFD
jgi:tRNA1(Val) A37 N6-methylase TrmN6